MCRPNRFFASLAEQLNRGATRAALGLLSFRSDPLREHLRRVFQSAPGTGSSFLADPVFEASFGWRAAEVTLGGLSGMLLHPDVVKSLRKPPRLSPKSTPFFTTTALSAPVGSLAGPYRGEAAAFGVSDQRTGSGKTECFLIPVLHDLAPSWTRGQVVNRRASGIPLSAQRPH